MSLFYNYFSKSILIITWNQRVHTSSLQLLRCFRDWSISFMRKGRQCHDCSAWRKEGSGGILSMSIDTWRERTESMDSCSFQWCLVSRIQEGPSEYQEVLLCCVDEKALAQHAQRGCGVFSLEISKSCLDTQCWVSLLEQRELYQMISRGPFQTKPCCATPPSYLEAFVCGGFWLTFKCFWCFKKNPLTLSLWFTGVYVGRNIYSPSTSQSLWLAVAKHV